MKNTKQNINLQLQNLKLQSYATHNMHHMGKQNASNNPIKNKAIASNRMRP